MPSARRVERRMEREREADRDRQVHEHPEELLAAEEAEVVVDRVQRAQEHRRHLALADPLLPAVRREHDVHRPDERPDDVVRRERVRREAVDAAAVRARDRRPDDEVDRRLGDHPERVHVGRGAVLELRLELNARHRRVEVEHRAKPRLLPPRRERAHVASVAKTCSITSSIGGSSTVRSATSCSASSCARCA